MSFNPYKDPQKSPRPKQIECFQAIDRHQSILANMWTGYGKTWVALYSAQKNLDRGKKFMISCPLRALVDQLTGEFNRYFTTLPVSGDYRSNKTLLFEPDYQGFCLTYEMAYTKIINPAHRSLLFEDIGTLMLDEVQLMSDSSRGAVIESLILMIQYFYPNIQLLLMSATIGNAEQLSRHFGLKLVKTEENERPVPLEKEIVEIRVGRTKEAQFSAIFHELCHIIEKFSHSFHEFPTMLVFCESRWLSKHLHQEISNRYPHIKSDYHNAGRTKKQRKEIEEKFRRGDIKMVFCTPTLAMGINVPCDITILTSVSRWNSLTNQMEMLEANEIIQKIGRAGRPGQKARLFRSGKQYGLSYIFCQPEERETVEEMIEKPLRIDSQIPKNLKYILLTWICAGINTVESLQSIYHRIFSNEIDDRKFANDLQWLQNKFFLKKDALANLSLTHSGRIVSYFAVQPETVLHLLRIKKQIHALNFDDLTAGDLFILMLATPEFTDNIRTDATDDRFKFILTNQFIHSNWIYDNFGQDKFMVRQIEAVKKAFAMAFYEYISLKYSLDHGKNIPEISFESGDLTVLDGIIQRILAAAVALLGMNWNGGKLLYWLAKGVEHKPAVFDPNIAELMQVEGIGIKTAVLLSEMGVKNSHFLAAKNPHHLASKLKIMVEKRNNALYNYCKRKNIQYRTWKAPSEKRLEKIINSISKHSKKKKKSEFKKITTLI